MSSFVGRLRRHCMLKPCAPMTLIAFASAPASFFTVKSSIERRSLPLCPAAYARATTAKRVQFESLSLMLLSSIFSPKIAAVSFDAIAASAGSFFSATYFAASAVFAYSVSSYLRSLR